MSCNSHIIFELKDVAREIRKNSKTIRTVDSISFKFNKGLIYSLVGPSGAGKSSFLRLLNRLDDPTEGEILYHGKRLDSYKPTELRKKVAMLFQQPYLFEGTVLENLRYCCDLNKDNNSGEILTRVGLSEEFLDKEVNDLSVGEKQRVALARALVMEPEVLLLDEPTSALDPSTSYKIEKLIVSLARELCLTVIIVTHNPEQAMVLGGTTLLIVKGKLVESGETSEVLTNPKTEYGQKYINKDLL